MENKMKRLELAKLSLKGISIGDAFGESFFDVHEKVIERINKRELKPGEWNFTDDTVMGIAIYKVLENEAEKSAKVTHFNIEGIAGAIAIALAAGLMGSSSILMMPHHLACCSNE